MRRLVISVLAAWAACAVPAGADQNDPRLDVLFARLQATDNWMEAEAIQRRIWQIWTLSGDQPIDQEMAKGLEAMDEGDAPAALRVFESIVRQAPDFAEGWNKRATIYYFMNRYEESLRDVDRTLALEPRHFGALAGLGNIYLETGREELALEAMEKALRINPHMTVLRLRAEELRRKYRGRPI